MAKKTVATLQTGKEGRSYTKVIKMVKSPKTGAYIFDEQWYLTKKFKTFSRNNSVGMTGGKFLSYIMEGTFLYHNVIIIIHYDQSL